MKNWFVLGILASFIVISCDKVDDPYEGIASGGETVIGDSIWSDTTHNYRKMYVEEFTGHTCFNCPRETKKLINWSTNEYAGKMIMTSIHYGAFAEPNEGEGYPADWRCTPGQEIHDKYGVLSYPSILANRTQSSAVAPGQWPAELAKADANTGSPVLKLKLLNIRDGNKNENKIIAIGEALSTISGDYTLGLMIVTDSVIAPQKDLVTRVEDYAHRHMLRGSIGSSIGNSFINGGLAQGDVIMKELNFQPDPSFDTTHLIIHAFVRNSLTEEIIQAEEVHVTKSH